MIVLTVPEDIYREARDHLLQNEIEQVAFFFCRVGGDGENTVLDVFDWHPVPSGGFTEQLEYYVELTDEEKARVIKEAWDRKAALVEVHSHPKSRRAEFSYSDLEGLHEFVPHVRWRLKEKPYAALIVGSRDMDALAWVERDGRVATLDEIRVGTRRLRPTGITYRKLARRK